MDQSMKVEEPGDTVLAFSNDVDFAILIPETVKKAGERELRRKGISGPTLTLRLFSAALFLLLKNYLDDVTLVTIDNEYDGHSKDITRMLLKHIWKVKPDFPKERIEVRQVTRKSPAHKKGWETQRGIIKPNKRIKAREFLEVL
ncbi:MAG: hypothetical protein ACE5NP_07785 [Anaerolineae bacterium]